MFELEVNQSDLSVKVILKGSVSIQNSNAVREIFLNALNQSDRVFIDHEKAEDFDLSYLQLVFSLHKTAIESGKDVQFNCKNPESFIALIKDSGFPPFDWLVDNKQSQLLGGK